MKTRIFVLSVALALLTLASGCGSAQHTAQAKECTEATRSEHPLACERQGEKADPGLAHTKLATEAIQRVEEGVRLRSTARTPKNATNGPKKKSKPNAPADSRE